MTPEQIREVVNMTLDELTRRKLLKSDYQNALRVVDKALYDFFNNKCAGICHILNQLSDDPYIEIIYLQYRDRKTIEWIAEYYNKDISTIKRNKKRLVMHIYRMLET